MTAPGRAEICHVLEHDARTLQDTVSPWIARWSGLVAPGSRVLDVACGSGRHARWFAARGCHVTAVDLDPAALDAVRQGLPEHVAARIDLVQADLEAGAWPFRTDGATDQFEAVVVTNYLWRPVLPTLVASVAPGGSLLYETFSADQAAIGRPTRAEFLLQPGELLQATTTLRTIAYEHGALPDPHRCVQRIVALSGAAVQPLR